MIEQSKIENLQWLGDSAECAGKGEQSDSLGSSGEAMKKNERF